MLYWATRGCAVATSRLRGGEAVPQPVNSDNSKATARNKFMNCEFFIWNPGLRENCTLKQSDPFAQYVEHRALDSMHKGKYSQSKGAVEKLGWAQVDGLLSTMPLILNRAPNSGTPVGVAKVFQQPAHGSKS